MGRKDESGERMGQAGKICKKSGLTNDKT